METFHVSGILQNVAFGVWLLSFSIIFLKLIHLLALHQYFIPLHDWLIPHLYGNATIFLSDRLWFLFFYILNYAAVNIHEQVFLWKCIFSSLEYVPGIPGSDGNSMFNVLRRCQTVFHSAFYHFTFPPVIYESSNFSFCFFFFQEVDFYFILQNVEK